MLQEISLYVFLHISGVLICTAFFKRERHNFAFCSGFVWGGLFWSFAGIMMTITGLALAPSNYLLLYGVIIVLVVYYNYKIKSYSKGYILSLAGSSAVFAGILFVVFYFIKPQPVLSGDSNLFITAAKQIAADQSLINYISISHGPYIFFSQYLSNIIDVFQIPYQMIALAIAFTGGFAYLMNMSISRWLASKKKAVFITLLAVIFMWSIPQLRYMACYVHTNFPVAVYFFFFITSIWLFSIEKETCWLVLASVSLLACCTIRYDAFVVCFPFLILAANDMEEAQWGKFKWIVVPTLLFISLWAFRLYSYELYGALLTEKSRLRPVYLSFYAGSLLFVFLFYFFLSKVQYAKRIVEHIPLVAIFLTVVTAIVLFSIKAEGMQDQFLVLVNIMLLGGVEWWKSFWFWSLFFWVVVLLHRYDSDSGVFTIGVPISLCLLFYLSFPLLHFIFFRNISANRMLTKYVPIIIFWLTVQACAQGSKKHVRSTGTFSLSLPVVLITILGTIVFYITMPGLKMVNYVNQGQLLWAPKDLKVSLRDMFDNNPSTYALIEPGTSFVLLFDVGRQIKPACFMLSEDTNYYFNNLNGNNTISDYAILVSKDKSSYYSVVDSQQGLDPQTKQIGRTTVIPYLRDETFRYFKFIYRKSEEDDLDQAITELSVLNRKPIWYSFL